MAKRLFVSIPIPQEWQNIFAEYFTQFSVSGVRWTEKENIHITVCFLGGVDEARIGEIKERVAAVCAHIAPFSLAFDRMAFGPPLATPRMVWAMFQESAEYAALVKEMQNALQEFLAVEPHKELIPHATLARFKDPRIAREIDVTKLQPALSSFEVRAVELVESHLDPVGVRHEVLDSFPLAKAE